MIFYESPHRIETVLQQMCDCFGTERQAVIARELTKTFETIHGDSLEELSAWVAADSNQRRGEFVLLVQGAAGRVSGSEVDADVRRMLEILAAELPFRQAAGLAAKITGEKKNRLYRYLIDRES